MTTIQWVCLGAIESWRSEKVAVGVLLGIREIREADGFFDWATAAAEKWGLDVKILAAEASAHNVKMHSYNGNMFSESMKDVDGAPAWTSLIGTPTPGREQQPADVLMALSTVPTATNPLQQNLAGQLAISAQYRQRNNTQVGPRTVPLPYTRLIPRDIRLNNNHIGPSGQRRRIIKVGVVDVNGTPLTATSLAQQIFQSAIEANNNVGRPDATVLSGFKAIDLGYFARLKSLRGINMMQPLVKLVLWMLAKFWGDSGTPEFPWAEAIAIDERSLADITVAPVYSWNDIGVFGENCGGQNAPVLPCSTAATAVFWHLTPATVPSRERNSCWVLPEPLSDVADDSRGYAIFVKMLGETPHVLHSLQIRTTDGGGNNGGPQMFGLAEDEVFIPGPKRIHIILARNGPNRDPTDQQTANNMPVMRPAAGPQGVAGIQANANMDINFIGNQGPLLGYDYATYIATWEDAISSADIQKYLENLATIINLDPYWPAVMGLVAELTVKLPAMKAAAVGQYARFADDAAPQFEVSTPSGLVIPQLGVNFPINAGFKSDYLIESFDPISWNKVALQLASAAEITPTGDGLVPSWLSRNIGSVYVGLRGMCQAINYDVMYANAGLPVESWDGLTGATDMRGQRRFMTQFFTSVATNGYMRNSVRGPDMEHQFQKLFGGGTGTLLVGNGNGITVHDRITMPRGTFAAAWYVNPVGGAETRAAGEVPHRIADVWVNMFSNVNKWQRSLPPPAGPDSTAGYREGMSPVIFGAGEQSCMLRQPSIQTLTLVNSLITHTDEELWNMRLSMLYVVGCRMATFQGVDKPDCPPTAEFSRQRGTLQQPFLPSAYPFDELLWNTRSFSRVSSNGTVYYPVAPRVQWTEMYRAFARKVRLGSSAWMISGNLGFGDLMTGEEDYDFGGWGHGKAGVKPPEQGNGQPTSEAPPDVGI